MSDLWALQEFFWIEFTDALQRLKPGKAPSPDSICPELITHAEAALKSCFLSFCLRQLKISKFWRRFLVVAIPKPMKPVGEDQKSYTKRLICLLCTHYKNLLRNYLRRVEKLLIYCSLKRGLVSTQEVNCGSSRSADPQHREFV